MTPIDRFASLGIWSRGSERAPHKPLLLLLALGLLAQVHKALQQPEMIVGVWQAGMALRERQEMDEPTVVVAMRQIGTVWDNLFPQEQHRIMGLLIERVQLHEDGLDIIWRDDSWQKFGRELAAHPFVVEQRERVDEIDARSEMEVA